MEYILMTRQTKMMIGVFNSFDEAYIKQEEIEANDKLENVFNKDFYQILKNSFDVQSYLQGIVFNCDYDLTYADGVKYVTNQRNFYVSAKDYEIRLISKETKEIVWQKKYSPDRSF